MQDAGKAASRRCFTGRVEEQADGAVLAKLDSEEQRGLAFRYRLKQVVVSGVTLGEASSSENSSNSCSRSLSPTAAKSSTISCSRGLSVAAVTARLLE
jgi:hypothetical protein